MAINRVLQLFRDAFSLSFSAIKTLKIVIAIIMGKKSFINSKIP
jgi:hypothetical protein